MMMDAVGPVATHQVDGNATKPKKGKGKKKGIWNKLPTWGSFHPFFGK